MAKSTPKRRSNPARVPTAAAGPGSGGQAAQARARLRDLALATLLVVLVWAVFLPCITGDFISLDDSLFVTNNRHVQRGLVWESIAWAFTNTAAANWHPLTWLSHMVDWELFGPRAWGHHLGNVFLHSLNTALVFLFLRRATQAVWGSLIAAALFGLHPMRVESVAWVAERKDVLCAFFFLVTLWAYVRYAAEPEVAAVGIGSGRAGQGTSKEAPDDRGWGSRRYSYYVLSLALYVAGLMSKPMVVTLPCVLLLLDFWPLGRLRIPGLNWASASVRETRPISSRAQTVATRPLHPSFWRLLGEKMPFAVLAGAVSLLTLISQRGAGAVTTVGLPVSERVTNGIVAYCRYLAKLAWPTHLAIFYPYPGHWPLLVVASCAALLLILSLAVIGISRRQPWWLVGWFWFLGTLVPVIGLVQVGAQSMADRYSYLPSIGLCVALVWGATYWARGQRWRSGLIRAVALLSLAWCLFLTRRQAGYWHDSQTVFTHALSVTQDNWMAHCNLGIALNKRGERAPALDEFREAVRIDPNYAVAQQNLGALLLGQGNLEEGLSHLQTAVRLKPDYALARCNLAIALRRSGRLEEAIAQFREALRCDPSDAQTHYDLAMAFKAAGRAGEAIPELREALKWQPNYPKAQKALDELESLAR